MQPMDEVYQKYARSVHKYLLSLSHSEEIAEELTQETFYQAIRSIDRYDHTCKMSTWLCSIAKRKYCEYLRKHPRHEEMEEADRVLQPAVSAENKYLASVQRIELMKTLHALPEPFKEVLYLRLFGSLSFKEIGEIMGKNENWARVNFYRGKEKLRKEIEDNEE